MTAEEHKECERVLGPEPWDDVDVPAFIRRRDEEEARARAAKEDEWIEEERERRREADLRELEYVEVYE